jgi:hypothetical protein
MSYRRSPLKSVQYGTITLTGVTSNTATLGTTVDTNFAVVRILGISINNVGPSPVDVEVALTLTNGTTVTADRSNGGGTAIVSYSVVEYMPWAVKSLQRGSITDNATGNTATITAVDVTKSDLVFAGCRTNVSDDRTRSRLDLTSSTVVTATRNSAVGTTITPWQVIEFK